MAGRRGALIGAMAAAGGLLAAGLAVVLPRALQGPEEELPAAVRTSASEPGRAPEQSVAAAAHGPPAALPPPGTSPEQPVAAAAPDTARPAVGTTGGPSGQPIAAASGPLPAPPTPDGLVERTLTATPASARWVSSSLALDCNPCTVRQPRGTRLAVELRAAGYVSQQHVLAFDAPGQETHTLTARTPAAAPAKSSRGAPKGRLTIDRSNPFEE
jgi:hypothetical protein